MNNPVEVMSEHMPLLAGNYVPTKVFQVRNKDEPWFDDPCRNVSGFKQDAHLRRTRDHCRGNWEQFVLCQVRTNETYSEAKHQFSDRDRDVLMTVLSPNK